MNKNNKEYELAWQIIANTDTNLFLTGKAGTGKTTFLKDLRMKVPKRMIVVAPTGIAAINAQGVTIHSFFQLPFGPQIPSSIGERGKKRYSFRRNKLRLLRTIDLVVIDEISMVRADLLDAIDEVLRRYRDRYRPFGGVQMLLIGDMQQLAPVARDEEWDILRRYYDTPYFFSSKALQQSEFVTVELKHVYRQNDPVFLGILNKVRTNTADEQTLALLNRRCMENFVPNKEDGYIRLTTHNYQADAINVCELEALKSPSRVYEASVCGNFSEYSFPTDKSLTLKVGAQVMFVKNDSDRAKRYYNGMIGEIVEMEEKSLKVRSAADGTVIEVVPETWQNMKYKLDEKTKEIVEELEGSFTQIPLKTAWAITVHKSQGLTFEHAIIDVQHSFAHGQTYVALSRCKTLQGMVLSAPIPNSAIICDRTVDAFANDPRHKSPDEQQLELMERQYMLRIVEDLFGFAAIKACYEDIIRLVREHFYDKYNKQYNAWVLNFGEFKKNVIEISQTFHRQYAGLIQHLDGEQVLEQFQERMRKGADYFETALIPTLSLLRSTSMPTNNQAIAERLEGLGESMTDAVRFKMKLLHYVAENGIEIESYLKEKAKIDLSNS